LIGCANAHTTAIKPAMSGGNQLDEGIERSFGIGCREQRRLDRESREAHLMPGDALSSRIGRQQTADKAVVYLSASMN
jgi:hypothetical protein